MHTGRRGLARMFSPQAHYLIMVSGLCLPPQLNGWGGGYVANGEGRSCITATPYEHEDNAMVGQFVVV